MNDEYLWDRSGEPDGDVARLEALLSRYRMRPALAPPAPARWRPSAVWYAAAVAAAVLAVLTILLLRPSIGWTVTGTDGTGRLAAGQTLRTGARSKARLVSRDIGTVDIAENTTITATEVREGRSTFELAVGSIHARTTSPPGVFVVDTPRARATDLGCEYTLSVEPEGAGRLHVDSGWVSLTRYGRQSLVPERASALFDREGHLMPPVFDDAAEGLLEAVREFSLGDTPPDRREAALATVLELARRRDALTLLNLFPIASEEERLRVYDRLNALVPAPPSIPREAMREWRIGTTEAWWRPVFEASGVRAIKKGKKPLPSAR